MCFSDQNTVSYHFLCQILLDPVGPVLKGALDPRIDLARNTIKRVHSNGTSCRIYRI